MLRLKQVSKFYSQNGVVTSGFSRVSLDFELGEFVAITGESGSGKSTLLNVISGLDSYEEGEMYIFDRPTSGYGTEEMEEYRKRYIGSIFQTFNLINNYTVYQNVELVLLLSGYRRREVQARVDEIIDKVGMSRYRNTKASKLSGGQKQRVAIARALAKETPIIVADEPTGNLDAESAAGIIRLLAGLSKDRLIIIVTHNYDQVEPYVTRKITMHDGRIAEDLRIRGRAPLPASDVQAGHATEAPAPDAQAGPVSGFREARAEGLSAGNAVRLGLRNTFSLPAKFFLLLGVFIFMCAGTFFAFTTTERIDRAGNDNARHPFFSGMTDDRVVVTRQDRGEFTDEDLAAIGGIGEVRRIEKNDLLLDTSFYVGNVIPGEYYSPAYEWKEGNFSSSLKLGSLDGMGGRIDCGRMAESPGEAVLLIEEGSYIDGYIEYLIGQPLYFYDDAEGFEVTVTGVAYMTGQELDDRLRSSMYADGTLCMGEATKSALYSSVLRHRCNESMRVNGEIVPLNGEEYSIVPSSNVNPGEVIIPDELAELFPYGDIEGRTVDITVKSMYFENTGSFGTGGAYNADNCGSVLGIRNWEDVTPGVYMNPGDINGMFQKGTYQISVFCTDATDVGAMIKGIDKLGYRTFYIKGVLDAAGTGMVGKVLHILRIGVLLALLIVLFFICYFIIKLIFRSRNVYFSTTRMLGATRRACYMLLVIEMFAVFNISYFLCFVAARAVRSGAFADSLGDHRWYQWLYDMVRLVEGRDFVLLYILISVLALLLALRYSRQLFRQTALNAYREEV